MSLGQEESEFNCSDCGDTGSIIVTFKEERTGLDRSAMKPCKCRVKARMEAIANTMPPLFRDAKLSNLAPWTDKHAKQERVIEVLRKNPYLSYLIMGRNGAGKTYLSWALWRNAAENGRRAIATTMAELMAEYRRLETSSGYDDWKPSVVAEDLRQEHTPYTIFIDEVEKIRVTPFTVEKLFDLVKAARDYKHQLIFVSNMNFKSLTEHFSAQDPVWGRSIMERFDADEVVKVDLF